MISRREVKKLLQREPRFEDIMCSLQSVPKIPRATIRETRQIIAYARKFNDEFVRPRSLEADRRQQENPGLLQWDIIDEANKRGFYSMWIPKLFGGKGYNFSSIAYAVEELASSCTGIANVVGVHYLGMCALMATWNARLINRILRETVEGEKTGQPCILSTAITEPSAGTDVEEVDLLDRGTVTCLAEKVKGGYVVNGTKVFISMGHVSTWCILIAYSDLKRPSDSAVVMAVKTGTKGLSFGRHEIKMGQVACPASELIFEDCFVPDELICLDKEQVQRYRQSSKNIYQIMLDLILGASRAGVAGFGTGVARGAFEEALSFAAETKVDGKLLINHEWAQCMLAEMYKNLSLARLTYVESNYANGLYGMARILYFKPLFYLFKCLPQSAVDLFFSRLMDLDISTYLFRKMYFDWLEEEDIQRTSGWASLAKFTATDMGMKNSQMALELMGQAGLRHDMRVEKHLRDSKLLQIYEGTNQLNRMNLFKSLVGRNIPDIKIFED